MGEGTLALRHDIDRARGRLDQAADAIELRLRTARERMFLGYLVRRHPVAVTVAGLVILGGTAVVVGTTVLVVRSVRRNLALRLLCAALR